MLSWWGVRTYADGRLVETTWTQAEDADDACKRVAYWRPIKGGARYQAEPMSICEAERIWS